MPEIGRFYGIIIKMMTGGIEMIPKIKSIKALDNFIIQVHFDDNKTVLYDVKEDFSLPGYSELKEIYGLFQQVQLDPSRTCVYWNDHIDLASDTIYEYGKVI